MAELPGEPTAPDIVAEHARQVREVAEELLAAFRYRGWMRTQLPRDQPGLLLDPREFRGQAPYGLFDRPLPVHVLPDRSYQERFIQQCVARGDVVALRAELAALKPERLRYADDLHLGPEASWSQLEERRDWVWRAYAAYRSQHGDEKLRVARAPAEWRDIKSGSRSWPNALELEQRALREVCRELVGGGIEIRAVTGPIVGDTAVSSGRATASGEGQAGSVEPEPDTSVVRARQRDRVEKALKWRAEENLSAAQSAKRLGIHVDTLNRAFKDLGVERPWRERPKSPR